MYFFPGKMYQSCLDLNLLPHEGRARTLPLRYPVVNCFKSLRGKELRHFLLLLLHGSVIPKIEATNHKVWATRKAIMVRLVVLHHHASVSTTQLLLLAIIRRYVFCTNYITALYSTTPKLHTTKYSNTHLQHKYSSSI